MPKGYVILTEVVHDAEGMAAYGQAAGPTLAGAGATVLVAGPAVELAEGEWSADSTVIVEFESVEAAKAWYHSDAYQEAAKLRQAATDSNVVILSGFVPRQS
jgi:uncharacterized protein (DUF1330 family)